MRLGAVRRTWIQSSRKPRRRLPVGAVSNSARDEPRASDRCVQFPESRRTLRKILDQRSMNGAASFASFYTDPKRCPTDIPIFQRQQSVSRLQGDVVSPLFRQESGRCFLMLAVDAEEQGRIVDRTDVGMDERGASRLSTAAAHRVGIESPLCWRKQEKGSASRRQRVARFWSAQSPIGGRCVSACSAGSSLTPRAGAITSSDCFISCPRHEPCCGCATAFTSLLHRPGSVSLRPCSIEGTEGNFIWGRQSRAGDIHRAKLCLNGIDSRLLASP